MRMAIKMVGQDGMPAMYVRRWSFSILRRLSKKAGR
jgi:hypothetical protein